MGTARAITRNTDALPNETDAMDSAIALFPRTEDQLRFGRPIRLSLLFSALLTIAGASDAAQPALRTNLSATPVTPKPFLELIRDRPSPDISLLLARCRSNGIGPDVGKSVLD